MKGFIYEWDIFVEKLQVPENCGNYNEALTKRMGKFMICG